MKRYYALTLIFLSIFTWRYNNYFFLSLYRKFNLKLYPFKQEKLICQNLEKKLNQVITSNNKGWSISVLNEKGQLIAEINGKTPRIPASNQKLLTTAYALDKLGPFHQLRTKLYYDPKGYYKIVGEGDPDLSYSDLSNLSSSIIQHSINNNISTIKVVLYEVPITQWWNKNWSFDDRKEAYGAPITRLALTSNAEEYSFQSPLFNFIRIIQKELLKDKISSQDIKITREPFSSFNSNKLGYPLKTIKSSPLYALIGLSNSESHNFTSEVLLRASANNWSTNTSSDSLADFISNLRLPSEKIIIDDASGLSRFNLITTNTLSNLLFIMHKHRYSNYYISSLSILGLRGTLRDISYEKELEANFFGKTGTLSGVRALSGYLNTRKGFKYVSIISNGPKEVNSKYSRILKTIYHSDQCN